MLLRGPGTGRRRNFHWSSGSQSARHKSAHRNSPACSRCRLRAGGLPCCRSSGERGGTAPDCLDGGKPPSLRWLREQQSRRTIPYIKVGARVWFRPSEVLQQLGAQVDRQAPTIAPTTACSPSGRARPGAGPRSVRTGARSISESDVLEGFDANATGQGGRLRHLSVTRDCGARGAQFFRRITVRLWSHNIFRKSVSGGQSISRSAQPGPE